MAPPIGDTPQQWCPRCLNVLRARREATALARSTVQAIADVISNLVLTQSPRQSCRTRRTSGQARTRTSRTRGAGTQDHHRKGRSRQDPARHGDGAKRDPAARRPHGTAHGTGSNTGQRRENRLRRSGLIKPIDTDREAPIGGSHQLKKVTCCSLKVPRAYGTKAPV